MKKLILFILCLFLTNIIQAQENEFTHADTLRGSITLQRAWWKVIYYDLNVSVQPEDSSITGYNRITYKVAQPSRALQIDLQVPLEIDRITQNGQLLSYQKVDNSNAYFIDVPTHLKQGSVHEISVYYHGHPKVAQNPPWDGGFIWTSDSLGHPWIATAVQGLGAGAWWPNKDHLSAEPDSMSINITVPDPLINVSNGRLRDTTHHKNGTITWSWFVSNPINNYNVAVNTGDYVNFTDTLHGRKGVLDLSYWPLKQHKHKARKQFRQVKPMLRCFENWFGPYPFYEDSYKLVEAPYLGMEHQSAVAYGNGYENGYRGSDLSGTGWGLKWDFIIIHESAHEWWGNSITAKDFADMWIHEAFASYAEDLYVECEFGKQAGAEYARGLRDRILNDRPIIGKYGVNNEGSGDMYYKGNNMLHMIRQIVDNDSTWKHILQGLQKKFYHKTVTSSEIENYINSRVSYDLKPVFKQYLRTTQIPTLQYYIDNHALHYRWDTTIPGFNMPVKVRLKPDSYSFIQPETNRWRTAKLNLDTPEQFKADKNFYIKTEQLTDSPKIQ